METISALEIVVGFPVRAEVFPALGGTLRIETGGTTYGVHLESGERIPARTAVAVHEPILSLRTTEFSSASGTQIGHDLEPFRSFSLWGPKGALTPISVQVGPVVAGNDDHVITCTSQQVSLLDRVENTARSIAVPRVIQLGDRVTGGTQGYMDRAPIYVDPGFVVFSRSPALLVVALADLERALVFDHVRWAVRVVLATREPDLVAKATRGRWDPHTVACQTGVLYVNCASDPIHVRDRMWPPNGWAAIDLADGTRVPAIDPPPEHYAQVEPVSTRSLVFVVRPPDSWSASGAPQPPPPPVGFEQLQTTPRQSTLAAALEYASHVHLPIEHLIALSSDADTAIAQWINREVFQGDAVLTATSAFAVPAIAAIVLDPNTKQRERIAQRLVEIAAAARRDTNLGVLHAFRRCLPLFLNLESARLPLKDSIATIVAVIAWHEDRPDWWRAAMRTIPQLEQFDDMDELDDVLM